MPKATFFNLSEEKRRRIVDLAIDEFAANSYHSASVSRIVERAGIAKGSIYQYFENKLDLYLYVLKLSAEKKLTAVDRAIAGLGPDPTVFDMLRAAVRGGLDLAHSEPRLTAIGLNFLRERDPEVFRPVMDSLMPTGEAIAEGWFSRAVEAGQIASWVRPSTALLAYFTLGNAVNQEMAEGRLTLDEAGEMHNEVLDILEFGLRPREGAGGPREKGERS